MNSRLFSKNFILLLAGQAVSLFGNCILDFALSMYILEITGNAAIFAGFLALAMVPTIVLSPLGGVLADRVNRRNIMVVLDFAAAMVVLISVMMIDHGNNLVIIGVTLVIQSVLGAFESPTVQACVPQMQTGDNIIRGNAAVSQISAVAAFTAPFLGSMLYTSFGLKPVMYAGVVCFLGTAVFECFIKLGNTQQKTKEHMWPVIKNDIAESVHFIRYEKPSILKILLLATVAAFFIQGIASVGFPYIVRTILGLNASYYGAALSILSFAGIAGSILAGVFAAKFKTGNLYITLWGIGLFLIPAGLVFLVTKNISVRYFILIVFFSLIQIAASVFSVFALSVIQQLTPVEMTGKVMAYTATFSLCAQPAGQLIYGILFEKFSDSVYLIIIPTGVILCITGAFSKGLFKKIQQDILDE